MIMRLAPSSIPVAMLQISSDQMTPAELYNLVYMRIRPLLVTVPGIVLPHPYGGQTCRSWSTSISRNCSPVT